MATLLSFKTDAATLEGLTAESADAALGTVNFEPLQIRAAATIAGSTLLIELDVRVPDLAPHAMLQFSGELGVLDAQDKLWCISRAERVFRTPGGTFRKLALGARRDVLKHARPDGAVYFGFLVGDVVLHPENRSAPHVTQISRAYLHPDFVVRRLRAENTRLARQLTELEGSFGEVLACLGSVVAHGDKEEVASPAVAHGGKEATSTPPAERLKLREVMEIVTAGRAVIARENPTELRSLQSVLGDLATHAARSLAEAESCVICMNAPMDVIFIPCGHQCCCAACAAALRTPECPMCRAKIEQKTPSRAAPAGDTTSQ